MYLTHSKFPFLITKLIYNTNIVIKTISTNKNIYFVE
nr:MAG TPA: hypothetical protein [Caudoviricetes sp.]